MTGEVNNVLPYVNLGRMIAKTEELYDVDVEVDFNANKVTISKRYAGDPDPAMIKRAAEVLSVVSDLWDIYYWKNSEVNSDV